MGIDFQDNEPLDFEKKNKRDKNRFELNESSKDKMIRFNDLKFKKKSIEV